MLGLQEASMLLGERIRDRRARDEAAVYEDFAEAPPRALLLGKCLAKIPLADQSSFQQQRAESTPTRFCQIHACPHQPTAEMTASFAGRLCTPSAVARAAL